MSNPTTEPHRELERYFEVESFGMNSRHRVWFGVGNQRLKSDGEWATRAEAEWHRDTLCKALAKVIEEQTPAKAQESVRWRNKMSGIVVTEVTTATVLRCGARPLDTGMEMMVFRDCIDNVFCRERNDFLDAFSKEPADSPKDQAEQPAAVAAATPETPVYWYHKETGTVISEIARFKSPPPQEVEMILYRGSIGTLYCLPAANLIAYGFERATNVRKYSTTVAS
jgi:hypothetical protein